MSESPPPRRASLDQMRCTTTAQIPYRNLDAPPRFTCKLAKIESRRADLRTADLESPGTSLLAHVLGCTGASGNCACLGGFWHFWQGCLSIVYRCVPARLQYRLQYIRGRQLVLRMRSLGIGQGTTEVGVVVAVEHSRSRVSIQYHKMWESLTGRRYAEERAPVGLRRRSMQDPGFGVPRIPYY